MNTLTKTILIVLGAILASAIVGYFVLSISYQNQEARIAAAIEAKTLDSQSHFTKMWEIMQNQAGVAEQYADDFKEIYPSMIEGRYKNGGGQMMQWITEHNPNFDTSLYSTLMATIEAQRESFHTNQTQLVDLSRQHNTLLKTWPGSFFLSNVQPIKVNVIVNNAAEEAFKTGKENTPLLFERNKKKQDTIK